MNDSPRDTRPQIERPELSDSQEGYTEPRWFGLSAGNLMGLLLMSVIAIFTIWWFTLRPDPLGPPDTAYSFEAVEILPDAVTLTWKHDGLGENIDHWKLKRRLGGSELHFVLINESMTGPARRVADDTVDPGTSYEYQLFAVGDKGHESAPVELALTTDS
ncbi:MAG: fibronectin type III domain-containing protein [Dehalococcoidia bacterium]|jgi:hypothetical protein|nr:fibronectin type III domain-containing protein [Dehalococcoidia bacterium]